MSVPEKSVDALYSALRSRDVRLTWCELEDAMNEVEEDSEVTTEAWVPDTYEGREFPTVTVTRPEYANYDPETGTWTW